MAVIEHARSMQKPISEIPGQVIVIEQIQFVSFRRHCRPLQSVQKCRMQ